MIVRVVPIKRLPKGLDFFDYIVPKELEIEVKVGQLVEIPLRKSNLFGLILAIKKEEVDKKNNSSLKELGRVVLAEPITTFEHLKFLYTTAQIYGVSLATTTKMSLLPLQKRKLSKVILKKETISQAKKDTKDIFYSLYENPEDHANQLKKLVLDTTLVLVPEVYQIDEVKKMLTTDQQEQVVVWHAGLSTKQQFENWLKIRNQEKTIIIGTRSTLMLPVPKLSNIIIDYEHADNHKSWDQAPRFHALDLAKIKAEITGAKLNLMSHSPSLESYFNIHKNNFSTENKIALKKIDTTTKIIDLNEERRAGRFGVLTDEIKEKIMQAEDDIFIYVNRVGFSRTVICSQCEEVKKCKNCQIPMIYYKKENTINCHYCGLKQKFSNVCSSCQSDLIELKGFGAEFVESGIRNLLANKKIHDIIRIDREIGVNITESEKPRIIIGTQMALKYIRWEKTTQIIILGIDQQLSIPEFRSTEKVWHTIQEIIYKKNPDSKLYIQTYQKNHLLFRSLVEPDRFYRTELSFRKQLYYPPYVALVRYFFGSRDESIARQQAIFACNKLKDILTKIEKLPKISSKKSPSLQNEKAKYWCSEPVEMQPKFYRNLYWFEIIIKLPKQSWERDITLINKVITPKWKIDPNPNSLLNL